MSVKWDPGSSRASGIRGLIRLVRLEHTLFSLPFAYAGMVLSGYSFGLREVIFATTAVFGLRCSAMSFNNIADLDIDRLNPRTRGRPLASGLVPLSHAWLIVVFGSITYFLSAALLNKYALILSPLPWLVAHTYPYAKRIHWLPHLHLGFTLGLVVFGGAIAASGCHVHSLASALGSVPWAYVAGVTMWVAGFDVIYSIMDLEFDRKHGLGSIPAKLGVKGALASASAMHATAIALFTTGCYKLGLTAIASVAVASILIAYENAIVWANLKNIPKAFNTNLAVSIIVSLGIILSTIT